MTRHKFFCCFSQATISFPIILEIMLLLSTTVWTGSSQLTEATVIANGTVYFAQPPSLVKTTTTFRTPITPSTYYFTLSLPAEVGKPLQSVTFTQHQGLEIIRFDLKRTDAKAQTLSDSRQQLTLGEVTRNSKTNTISVMFNPPVLPGRTVTIGLRAVANPQHGGVYLFGVTAYPADEKSHGQFLGFGRIQFTGR
jgi:hypothetical protein